MENSLPGKKGQHLVCIKPRELRIPEPEWEILLSIHRAGGVWLLVRNWQLLPAGTQGLTGKKRESKEEGNRKLSLHCGWHLMNVIVFFFLAAPYSMQYLSSPTRDWTHCPSIGRWILNCWATRETCTLTSYRLDRLDLVICKIQRDV